MSRIQITNMDSKTRTLWIDRAKGWYNPNDDEVWDVVKRNESIERTGKCWAVRCTAVIKGRTSGDIREVRFQLSNSWQYDLISVYRMKAEQVTTVRYVADD